MDLMRTLLIYMSATLTLAVQSTAAPKVTPVPTQAPHAVVEKNTTPAPGAEVTAIPPELLGSQATPASKYQYTPAPVPEITPNTKAYHNIGMGAKGKEVKKLQERLVALGYLPEGAADGAYGRQSYNAVKKFQYYNGLTADGIAGRKTQTYLFENKDVFPNPEAAPAVTEAPATPVPEIETPETEAPVTEAPVTEAPATEAPVTEAPVTEAPAAEAQETEAPAEEAPAKAAASEAPEETAEPEEIVENVDLDADVYEPIVAAIALNEGDGPLEYVVMEDGVPVLAQPRLSWNGAKIRVSLDDLCKCVDGWELTDDDVGTIVLEAAGYTLALYNEDTGCSATVNGTEIPMKEEDFDFVSDGHFIDAEFLANALKGEAVWDQEENTLMLRIRGKDAVESED